MIAAKKRRRGVGDICASCRTLETRREYRPWILVPNYTYSLRLRFAARRHELLREHRKNCACLIRCRIFIRTFSVPQASKANARIETNATRAFDNVTKKTEALMPIDLTKSEIDLHLIDHHGDCILRLPDHAVCVRGSAESP